MNGLALLLADSVLQGSADLVVGLVILAFAWLGSRFGLFLATVWGLQALASVVAAFALCDIVDGWVLQYGGSSEFIAFWHQSIAFVASLTVVAVAIRLAIGSAIEEGATNYPPLVDLAGGGVIGATTGMIVAGIIQVVLAMAPLPERFAFDPSKSAWDLGSGIVELVGHCAGGMDPEAREIMMDGEPGFPPDKVDPVAAAPAPPVDPTAPPVQKIELPQWSEVFADTNWNQMWDKGEKYLDADGNGAFTWIMRSNDRNTSKTRDIGLRERYKLGPWVTVGTLEKQQVQRLQSAGKLGEIEGLPWPPPGGMNPGVTPAAPPTAVPPVSPLPGQQFPGQPVPGQAVPGQAVPGQAVPGQAVAPAQPGQPTPAQPIQPGRPAQGNLPGLPKQPGQPASSATPAAETPPTVPGTPVPGTPVPTPVPPQPPPQTPGRANETPILPPGPASPFKPKK